MGWLVSLARSAGSVAPPGKLCKVMDYLPGGNLATQAMRNIT